MDILYDIRLDFDAEGEPPAVYIWQEEEGDVLEVFEEPTCKLGGKLIEIQPGVWEWDGPWSWNEMDWEPGPLAMKILKFLQEDEPAVRDAEVEELRQERDEAEGFEWVVATRLKEERDALRARVEELEERVRDLDHRLGVAMDDAGYI